MNIQSNVSLKAFNTFQIDVKAKAYLEIQSVDEVLDLILNGGPIHQQLLILGGGSNILFTKDFEGLVLKNNILGIELLEENEHHYYVRAGAGVNWHQFVLYCIENGYAGVENLSLIPGNVGASPMQNIGAYGIEVKDIIESVEAIDLASGESRSFSKQECEFDYRSSIFKTSLKNELIITAVTYKLNKTPVFNTSYGAIQEELDKMGIQQLTIEAVSKAVCNIRNSKLPDPGKIGNAGSFFKNPIVTLSRLKELQVEYPTIPSYKVSEKEYKIAAGWLIEQCGWKGKKIENFGVHSKQALVLVNYGGAIGKDIYKLSQDILDSVKLRFNIALEREVNIV